MNGTTERDIPTTIGNADLNMTERWIEAVILTIIAFFALSGNISLWFIITRSKRLRTNSNFFILCLSGADILVSAVNMPVIVYTILAGEWKFSEEACVVLGYITMLTFVASVMSLCAISLNRYIMICYPGKYKSIYTRRNAALIIAGVWFVSALLALPPLVGWASYGYLPGQSFCFCDWKTSISYTFFMVFVCFGGPCSVMTYCYINILRTVNKSKRRVQGATISGKAKSTASGTVPNNQSTNINDGTKVINLEGCHVPEPSEQLTATDITNDPITRYDSSGNLDRNPSYRKANNAYDSFKQTQTKKKTSGLFSNSTPLKLKSSKKVDLNESNITILSRKKKERRRQEELRLTTSFVVVIICFITCWLPFCVTMFWSVFSTTPVPRVPDILTLLLGCLNSCCNPIIYGAMNRNFRDGFKKLYCNCWKNCFCFTKRDESTSTSAGMRSTST